MADYDFTALAATALRLIARFGRDVQIVTNSPTPLVAGQEWLGPVATVASVTARAVWVDRNQLTKGGGGSSLSESIAGRFLVAASSFPSAYNPNTAQNVVDGSKTFGVVKVNIVKPASLPLVYEFDVEA